MNTNLEIQTPPLSSPIHNTTMNTNLEIQTPPLSSPIHNTTMNTNLEIQTPPRDTSYAESQYAALGLATPASL